MNSIEISAGSYFVDTITGDSFSYNCTELDEDNGDLQWFSYSTNQNIYLTVTSDLGSNQKT